MKFYTRCDMHSGSYYIRGYENGEQFFEKHKARPYHFELCPKDTESKYRTIDGKKVFKKVFDSGSEIFASKREIAETANRECYGMEISLYPFIYDNYKGEIEYDPRHIRVINIDIEVEVNDGFPDPKLAKEPFTAITMHYDGIYYTYAFGEYKPNRDDVIYKRYDDEYAMIIDFIDDWRKINPDVVTGWNVEGFDIPYMVNRFTNVVGESHAKKLSPVNVIYEKTIMAKTKFGAEEQEIKDIRGLSVLDYLVLYKKFTYKQQENYRLDTIAQVELGEKKLDYSEYGNLMNLYKENHQLFVEYNVKDVELVQRLEDKLGLLDQVYALSYDAKVNFPDALTSVKMWDVIIHNHLMDRNIVVPSKPTDIQKDGKIRGAYVKEPKPGMYDWVCSFDLDSLYPHLMMQYNISPDTFVGHIGESVTVEGMLKGGLNKASIQESLDKSNCCITASGFMFTKNKKGFLSELMETMYQDRVKYKKMLNEASKKYRETGEDKYRLQISRYNNMQMAKKIQLNSVYGALSNEWFRWFDINCAESITLSGQLAIRWIQERLNEYLNKVLGTKDEDFVIASDTDSLYVTFDKLVKLSFGDLSEVPKQKVVNFLDKVCDKKIKPFIEKSYQELADYTRAHAQKMSMKRECIADKGIWTRKKRYALNVYVNEGDYYDEPKLKIMGLEAIKSSTPSVCRGYLIKTLELIMTTDEQTVIKHISNIKNNFSNHSFEDVAFPRSANNIRKWEDNTVVYKKGTPAHVKGVLLYNKALKDFGLDKQYEKIKDAEKIKFCYLKTPNKIKDKVISCSIGLPKELELERYIDYKLQYEKGFLSPIKAILDAVGWKHESRNTLPFFVGE